MAAIMRLVWLLIISLASVASQSEDGGDPWDGKDTAFIVVGCVACVFVLGLALFEVRKERKQELEKLPPKEAPNVV